VLFSARYSVPLPVVHHSDEVFENSVVFVMKHPETSEILAMLALEPHGDDEVIELKSFSVAEAARRQGLGQRMLSYALEACRSMGHKGVKLLTLDVLPDARRLYERNGFRVVREEPTPFYRLYYYHLDLDPQ
jgi:GNAT superfamily N-acetyltransferase